MTSLRWMVLPLALAVTISPAPAEERNRGDPNQAIANAKDAKEYPAKFFPPGRRR